MKTGTTFQRAALAGAFLFSALVGGPAVMAQGSPKPDFEPNYFESMLTGYEIEVSGSDFEIDDVVQQNYTDGENEQVYIESDFASAQVSFLDDSDSPEETIELWISNLSEGMDTLEVADSGVDGDVTWYYATGEYEDAAFVYYIQVQEDVDGNIDMLESVLTVDGMMIDAVEVAQQDITVDGDGFMDDVDLDELQELVDGGSFRDGGNADDDSDTGEDDDQEPSRDRPRARDRSGDDADPDATQESDEADDDGR